MKKADIADVAKEFIRIIEEQNIDSNLAIAGLKVAAEIINQKVLQDFQQASMLAHFKNMTK